MKSKSFFKQAAVVTLSVGLILSSTNFNFAPKASAASSKAESILASLTPEQRNALKQLELTEQTGLRGFNKQELNSEKEVDVIVQFHSKPGKIAVLDAEVKGKKLSKEKADERVAREHEKFKKDIQSILSSGNIKGKQANHTITSSYNTVYNGVTVKLPANQVVNLLKSDVVKAVYKNETYKVDPIVPAGDGDKESSTPGTSVESLSHLKVDKLREEGLTGKGVKVGVIDTGIDYNHPDLQKVYKGGYDFVDKDNDPMETTYEDWKKTKYPEVNNGSAYYTSHGTHVSGTIAGQGTNKDISVEGVAPEVDLYAYRVLGPYGTGTANNIIAAVEKAVEDGMDIINLSLGSGINDPYYPTSTVVNNAVLSGVTAVVAAGNAGPGEYTLGSPGAAALALTIGASDVPMTVSTFKGQIGSVSDIKLVSMARHYLDKLKELEGRSLQVVDVGIGANADYNGKEVQGKAVLIARGEIALHDKVALAKQKGTAAVLLSNNVEGQINANLGESTLYIPTFSVAKDAGEKIKAQLQAGQTGFTFSGYGVSQTEGDHLADFSSRGPVRQTYGMKPEVVAPGVSVLSTVPYYIANPKDQGNYQFAYSRFSGTSMATPFTAGVAALMLQANPKLEPEDIKTVLMNTANPLNGNYSIFEAGAGIVNPYKAVHHGASFQVLDKTLIPGAENLVEVKSLTGGLSFNHELVDTNLQITKSIKVKNNEKMKKMFSVDITEGKGSNSLKQNGMKINLANKITINGNEEKTITAKLLSHKKAKEGYYTGYITFTNTENSAEQYRLPFSFRLLEEGFNKIEIDNPVFSPGYLNEEPLDYFREPYVYSQLNIKAPMEKLDVILQDEKGNDLGLIGTANLNGAYDSVTYGLTFFNGLYYKFTGDPEKPISSRYSFAQEGHYKIKFIGTGQSGKTFYETRHLWIYLNQPNFDSSLDGASPFIEYKPGQATYPFEIRITDPIVDEVKKYGLNYDQSSNYMVYYWGPWGGFPSTPIYMDKDGRFVEEVAMKESEKVLYFRMDGYNTAGNKINKDYYFVKEGTPVTYPTSDTTEVNTGGTIKATIMLDNVQDIAKADWNFNDSFGFKNLEVVDAKLADAFVDKAKIDLKGDHVTVEFHQPSDEFDQQAVAEVTIKVSDDLFFTQGTINPTVAVTDGDNKMIRVFNAPYTFKINPQFSVVEGTIGPEGFFIGDPEWDGYLSKKDWTKVGGSVKLMDSNGQVYDATSSIDPYGKFNSKKLPVSQEPYILEMKAPGHFLTKVEAPGAIIKDGKANAINFNLYMTLLTAGDVNQDGAIDVLDALAVQKVWKTADRAADINFDGVVDEKDMAFVQKNYLKQNQDVENAPEPKKNADGKTLEMILAELGIGS
ncbi:S8 family serine peptidase [Bacillus sp. B-jedd]|uniref:S8 family serine peptidase n=1 Tax=Bacillus sp. B-jedd TaxID=1476857 RepID=UPI0005156BB9|nr:S8 family serine peptidase [Bacillus sp. B-jedd]CEG29424.1 peptidase Vpr [Bacillus sp. B-jedd]